MTDHEWLAAAFDQHRPRLRSVAFRVLGSQAEADDAVQEAWLRLSRSQTSAIGNLGGWLTTVVGRVALDMLRAKASRREDLAAHPSPAAHPGQPAPGIEAPPLPADPAVEAELADSVGLALMVVLDRLTPAERLAFVLHDLFGVPFDELGAILERSANAAKQLASRARTKVRGVTPPGAVDAARQRQVVEAFLAAARNADFDALLGLLDPDIVLEADTAAVRMMGAPRHTKGATAVAAAFSGRALHAQAAVVDGNIGIAWVVGGRPRVAWNFYIDEDSTIVHIDLHADPAHTRSLGVVPLHAHQPQRPRKGPG